MGDADLKAVKTKKLAVVRACRSCAVSGCSGHVCAKKRRIHQEGAHHDLAANFLRGASAAAVEESCKRDVSGVQRT